MAILSILIVCFCCVPAAAETWSFSGRSHLDRIPQDEFRRQVRYGMATISRYFTREMREVSSGGSIRVTVRQGPTSYLNRTAWYERGTINFGLGVASGSGPAYTAVQADFVRRTIIHELFHHFIPSINYHNWQSQLRGNRVVDIGDLWHGLTEYDCRQLVNRAGFQWRSELRPWNDIDRWWLPRYSWTNATDRFDVNADGRRSAVDALSVINALHRGVRFDEFQKPPQLYDVNEDRNVSATDALAVINALKR